MSKLLFRYLRGELNGVYLQAIHNSLNECTKDIRTFFVKFKNEQLNKENMREKDIYGLGKFAGIFLPVLSDMESRTSVRMSESHVVDGSEYSERGLFDTDFEKFNFYHTSGVDPNPSTTLTSTRLSMVSNDATVKGYILSSETDVLNDDGTVKEDAVTSEAPNNEAYSEYFGNEYSVQSEADGSSGDEIASIKLEEGDVSATSSDEDDISAQSDNEELADINTLVGTEGHEHERSTVVGTETATGYIYSSDIDKNVIKEDGTVDTDYVHSEPPSNGEAYTEFYGDKFLYLSEGQVSYQNLKPELYLGLFKALQWVRYNRMSLTALCNIINVVCPNGMIKISDLYFVTESSHYVLKYKYDENANVTLKTQRIKILEYIISMKFPNMELSEVTV